MAAVEALREVKRVEDEVRRKKEEARREAQEILRKARADVADVEARGKADGDAAYQAEVDKAAKDVQAEKARILKAGQTDADKIAASGSGAALASAVDVVVRRFNDKIRG